MNASNLVIGGGLAIGPALAGRLIEGSGGFLPLLPIAAGLAGLLLAWPAGHAETPFPNHGYPP